MEDGRRGGRIRGKMPGRDRKMKFKRAKLEVKLLIIT